MIFKKDNYVFFESDLCEKSSEEEGVHIYVNYFEVPAYIKKEMFLGVRSNVMAVRMIFGNARLIVKTHNHNTLVGYGWIQSWKIYKRRYKIIGTADYMLGPYYVAKPFRKKGFYKMLLSESLKLIDRNDRAIIYASENNTASLKGIQQSGFRYVCRVEVMKILSFSVKARRLK